MMNMNGIIRITNSINTPATWANTFGGMTNTYVGGVDMFSITKKCTKCGVKKTIGDFYTDKTGKDGVRSVCKVCHNLDIKSRIEGNPQKYTKLKSKAQKKWRDSKLEERREKGREYARAHTDQKREADKRRYWENLEASRNKERMKAHRRRVSGDVWTLEEENQLITDYGFRCVYCNKKKKRKDLTLDHVIPITKGGTNSIENLVPACCFCNLSKGNKSIVFWLLQRLLRVITSPVKL